MFFRILKLDLKKKKVMNTLLLLFIILAAIFSASGLNIMEDNNLSVGDEITIDLGDTKINVKIAGKMKDAFLGSKIKIYYNFYSK